MNNDNMNELNTYLKKAGEKISLTQKERTQMRDAIYRYMELKPIRTSRKSFWGNLTHAFLMRPIAIGLAVLVLFSSAGLSYAAGNTLPGDFLYPLKVSVSEPLSGILAISQTAKTEWAMDIAGERIKEATILAAESRLTADAQRKIETNFEEHAQAAIENLEAKATAAPERSAETAARFEARLSEYGRILAEVGSAKNVATDELSVSIRAKQDHVTLIRVDAETEMRTGEDKGRKTTIAASRLRDVAREKLQESSKRSRGSSAALSSSSAENIALEIENASSTLATGENLLERDDAPQALGAFRGALTASEKVDIFLKTSAAINKRTGLKIGEPNQVRTASLLQKRGGKKKDGGEKRGEENFAAEAAPSANTIMMQSTTIGSDESSKEKSAKIEADEERSEDDSNQKDEDEKSGEIILRLSAPVSELPSF